MAAPANVEEFLDLVHKSGVTDEKRLDLHVQRLRQTESWNCRAQEGYEGQRSDHGFSSRFGRRVWVRGSPRAKDLPKDRWRQQA